MPFTDCKYDVFSLAQLLSIKKSKEALGLSYSCLSPRQSSQYTYALKHAQYTHTHIYIYIYNPRKKSKGLEYLVSVLNGNDHRLYS